MRLIRDFASAAGLFLLYVIAGKLSLRLAFIHPSASVVWPPTGIALAALLVMGMRFWPAILAGAFVVNVTTAGTTLTSLGIATGNTLEAVVGCWLVTKFAGGRNAFDTPGNVLRYALVAATLSTCISATVGVTSLALGGFVDWVEYASVWVTWWLGDACGALIVAPLLLLWMARPLPAWDRRRFLELAALFLLLAATAAVVFGGYVRSVGRSEPRTYLCAPFLIWAALRFNQRKAATAMCLLSAIAVAGTLRGTGPFVVGSPNASLLHLHSFLGVMSLMTLVFAAEVAVRRRQEERVRYLAVSDPLTGLANYRRLVEALDAEVKRYGRSGRPFAVLLLDLDELKQVNDHYGHLTGNRAICRVADVLRVHCREVDTPARYGGDEFALVLPETSREAALLVAGRISRHLAEQTETPKLTVSIGVAVYPEDGQTMEQLLGSADRALYQEKR
ncbi:MAG TPA: MASE1 domain-containing protein [Patescibacteria group bacterium]|nr:MASE1 domain-containing protein [Patescibacteria group bacterium]